MANHEHHGAKGNMYLQRNWEESSSGHTEHYDDIELVSSPDGKNIILVKTQGQKNFIKISETYINETKIKISVQEMVNLIEQYGQKI